MIIDIQYIPQIEHRYNTVGDWWLSYPHITPAYEPTLHIRATRFPDERYSLLIAYHELTEALCCIDKGITPEQVDEWDFAYEKTRELLAEAGPLPDNESIFHTCGCPVSYNSEPGEDPHAPYYFAHQIASVCEHTLCTLLGIKWSDYENAISEGGD